MYIFRVAWVLFIEMKTTMTSQHFWFLKKLYIDPPIFCKNKYVLGLHFQLLTWQLLSNHWTVTQQLLDSYSSVTGQLLVIGALCNYFKRTLRNWLDIIHWIIYTKSYQTNTLCVCGTRIQNSTYRYTFKKIGSISMPWSYLGYSKTFTIEVLRYYIVWWFYLIIQSKIGQFAKKFKVSSFPNRDESTISK